MPTSEAFCDEIDQLLADRNIEYLIDGGQRGFLYAGMPVCAGVLAEDSESVVALGAVVLSHVDADSIGSRRHAKLLAQLDRLKKDFPDAMLEFTEANQVVWSFRAIASEDFTTEVFLRELESLTTTAAEIAPQVRGRLATGVLGTETGLVGLQPPAPVLSRQRAASHRAWEMWLTRMSGHRLVSPDDEPSEDSTSTELEPEEEP